MNNLAKDLQLTSQVDAYYYDVWEAVIDKCRPSSNVNNVCRGVGLQVQDRSSIFNIRQQGREALNALIEGIKFNA